MRFPHSSTQLNASSIHAAGISKASGYSLQSQRCAYNVDIHDCLRAAALSGFCSNGKRPRVDAIRCHAVCQERRRPRAQKFHRAANNRNTHCFSCETLKRSLRNQFIVQLKTWSILHYIIIIGKFWSHNQSNVQIGITYGSVMAYAYRSLSSIPSVTVEIGVQA